MPAASAPGAEMTYHLLLLITAGQASARTFLAGFADVGLARRGDSGRATWASGKC